MRCFSTTADAFVCVVSVPLLTPLSALFQYHVQALYDFKPQEQGELEFQRGDIITVTDRSDQHWWNGEIGDRKGLFPNTYVTTYHT